MPESPVFVSWTDFQVSTLPEFDPICLSHPKLLNLISALFLLLLVPCRDIYHQVTPPCIYSQSRDNLPVVSGTAFLAQREASSSLDFLHRITRFELDSLHLVSDLDVGSVSWSSVNCAAFGSWIRNLTTIHIDLLGVFTQHYPPPHPPTSPHNRGVNYPSNCPGSDGPFTIIYWATSSCLRKRTNFHTQSHHYTCTTMLSWLFIRGCPVWVMFYYLGTTQILKHIISLILIHWSLISKGWAKGPMLLYQ